MLECYELFLLPIGYLWGSSLFVFSFYHIHIHSFNFKYSFKSHINTNHHDHPVLCPVFVKEMQEQSSIDSSSTAVQTAIES